MATVGALGGVFRMLRDCVPVPLVAVPSEALTRHVQFSPLVVEAELTTWVVLAVATPSCNHE
jgi:hypothetical protein